MKHYWLSLTLIKLVREYLRSLVVCFSKQLPNTKLSLLNLALTSSILFIYPTFQMSISLCLSYIFLNRSGFVSFSLSLSLSLSLLSNTHTHTIHDKYWTPQIISEKNLYSKCMIETASWSTDIPPFKKSGTNVYKKFCL